MKRKSTLVQIFGGPKQIVQEFITKPKTIAACPVCRTRFRRDDATVLVDLVKRIGLVEKRDDQHEVSVRIHLCQQCAQPIIQQKKEAMDQVIDLLAELMANDVLKELSATDKAGSKKSE
jgi:hypothetical protein